MIDEISAAKKLINGVRLQAKRHIEEGSTINSEQYGNMVELIEQTKQALTALEDYMVEIPVQRA